MSVIRQVAEPGALSRGMRQLGELLAGRQVPANNAVVVI